MSGANERSGQLTDTDVRQRVHEIIKRRMSGDIDGMARYFFEDVQLNYNCAKLWRYPPVKWRGREALITHTRDTDVNVEPLDYEVTAILVDGDRCAVRWRSNWRHRGTGRHLKLDMAHFLRWRNDLVIEMDEYIDHHAVARAAGPISQTFEEMLSSGDPGVTREEIFEHLSRIGNFAARRPDVALFRRLCAPDVICEFAGDRNKVSYAGRHRGVESLINIIRTIDVEFEQLGNAMPGVVIDGAQAAMRRTVEWRHRGTGRRGLVELADFFRYRDGKIIELIEFRDSVALLQMQD
ncbi:MAG: nuclear transport factor 2 family protein [Methylocystis sp.]|nr:nuclear transport factor 2 family protein [Methylocystis sp.]